MISELCIIESFSEYYANNSYYNNIEFVRKNAIGCRGRKDTIPAL